MKPSRSTSTRTTSAVSIFVGALLIVIFAIGLIASDRPDTFYQKDYYDFSLIQFVSFCRNWWLPAGIIGFPVFLFSLIRSLIQESREKK